MAYIILTLGGGELLVVFLVFLVLFGSSKIPELAKGLGKGLREFKKATDDIKREINNSTDGITRDISESVGGIRKNITDITSDIASDINQHTQEINANINAGVSGVNQNQSTPVPEAPPEKKKEGDESSTDIHEITDNLISG